MSSRRRNRGLSARLVRPDAAKSDTVSEEGARRGLLADKLAGLLR